MDRYRSSCKCKYCGHFQPSTNRCYLYHDYDQSLDKDRAPSNSYFKLTEPDNVYKNFTLSAMEVMVSEYYGANNSPNGDRTPQRRKDGSYVVQMPQSMREEFEQEEKDKSFREWLFAIVIVGIGLLIFWLIFGPFITGILEMVFDILNFLF